MNLVVKLDSDVRVTLKVTTNQAGNYSTVRATRLALRNRQDVSHGECLLAGDIRVNGLLAANLVLSGTQRCAILYDGDWDYGTESSWSGYTAYDLKIPHREDGTAEVTVAAAVQIYTADQAPLEYLSRTASAALPRIPRATTLEAEAVPLGQELTLTLNRAASGFRDTVAWECGEESGTLATLTAQTTLRWTPPLALAAQAPADTGVKLTFTVTTYDGQETVGSNQLRLQCPIPAEVVPTVSLTVSDRLGYPALHGGYIQGQSQAQVRVTATGAYGSTIQKTAIRCAGLTQEGQAEACFALEHSGPVAVEATVTDSRGRTAAARQEITVLAYSKPAVQVTRAFRCAADGTEQSNGEYLCVCFTAALTPVENGAARYTAVSRIRGGAESSRVELTQYAGQFQVTGAAVLPADPDDSFECAVEAADSFASAVSASALVGIAFVLLDLSRDKRSVGIGMRSAGSRTLTVGLDTDLTAHRLQNLAAPAAPQDAATKAYVDAAIQSLRQSLGL